MGALRVTSQLVIFIAGMLLPTARGYVTLGAGVKAQLLAPLNRAVLPVALTDKSLAAGTVLTGDRSRLRYVLQKLLSGAPIKTAYIGDGSKTAASDQHAKVFATFEAWVKRNFPNPKHVFTLWAKPGMTPGFATECIVLSSIPPDVDLVWLAFATNAFYETWGIDNLYTGQPFESLVRKLLVLPNAPAVVPLQLYNPQLQFYETGGPYFQPVAEYYRLPLVSLRNLAYLAGIKKQASFKGLFAAPTQLSAKGVKLAAALMGGLLKAIGTELILQQPYSAADGRQRKAALPGLIDLRPSQKGVNGDIKYNSGYCLFGSALKKRVSQAHGFAYAASTKLPYGSGFAATKAGASLVITFNSTTGMRGGYSGNQLIAQDVALAVVRGPTGKGQLGVECISGCTCTYSVINGAGTPGAVVGGIVSSVSQADSCKIKATVLSSTHSKGHAFKIVGIIKSANSGYLYTKQTYGFSLPV